MIYCHNNKCLFQSEKQQEANDHTHQTGHSTYRSNSPRHSAPTKAKALTPEEKKAAEAAEKKAKEDAEKAAEAAGNGGQGGDGGNDGNNG